MKRSILAVAALASLVSSTALAGMPGITVPDMDQAVAFFTDIVGCQKAMSFGPFADDKGTFMTDLLGVDANAVIVQITQMRCGSGSNVELFKYTAPDQKTIVQKNSDIGAFHLAFYVDDIKAVKAFLDEKKVPTRLGPLPVDQGPAAGQAILYFQSPWGLQLEAITYPNGMAYEKDGGPILWSPKDPAK
jgi:catechol 2,3-dioxygenase-like lactoylglutathione lyase family enzyme